MEGLGAYLSIESAQKSMAGEANEVEGRGVIRDNESGTNSTRNREYIKPVFRLRHSY